MANDISSREKTLHRSIPSWRLVSSQHHVDKEIIDHCYAGSGTLEDPYRVEWLDNDPINPLGYPNWHKWSITLIMALSTLSITFASSGLAGAAPQLEQHFGASAQLVTADVSLYVLAFALGPAVWGPLSEVYGRQVIFATTYAGVTVFGSCVCASNNIATVLVLRFISAAFGASTITNAAGVIADLFAPNERGLAGIAYVSAPFLGPCLGPMVCGFLAESAGWKWVAGLIAIFTGSFWILGLLIVPETYAPVLLKKRATKLSKITGKVYISKLDAGQTPKSMRENLKVAVVRPWIFLIREPIVLFSSIYIAVRERGWSQGLSGLSFVGIMIGQLLGMVYAVLDTARYKKVAKSSPGGRAPPEAWLAPSLVGAVALPVGLFWFAWTNGANIHWAVSLVGIMPFGFGQVLVFLSINQYLIDAYSVYAASTLAANASVRALFGAAFPLFTTPMYNNLGVHWASSIPAFLALLCLPFPFIFHRYGLEIRKRCEYSADAMRITEEMARKTISEPGSEPKS